MRSQLNLLLEEDAHVDDILIFQSCARHRCQLEEQPSLKQKGANTTGFVNPKLSVNHSKKAFSGGIWPGANTPTEKMNLVSWVRHLGFGSESL